jgi:steroid 5-alpha reductase family enzyme
MAAIPSLLLHTEKHYDLTGSLTFLAVLGVACGLASGLDIRCKVLVVMVALWAARLGSYLFYRAIKNGGDRRFDEIKKSPFRLLTAWTLQGLWVFYTALPALTVIWGTHRVEMDT